MQVFIIRKNWICAIVTFSLFFNKNSAKFSLFPCRSSLCGPKDENSITQLLWVSEWHTQMLQCLMASPWMSHKISPAWAKKWPWEENLTRAFRTNLCYRLKNRTMLNCQILIFLLKKAVGLNHMTTYLDKLGLSSYCTCQGYFRTLGNLPY